MGVKIAVVGGGSTYTPELVEGFARRHERLPIDELVLLDIDPERLEIVAGVAGWSSAVIARPRTMAPISCSSTSVSAARPPG